MTGRVQGVGYRDWAIRAADAARIAGWVQNRADGSVEVRVQGGAAACDRFITGCRHGPPSCRVTRIEVSSVAVDAGLRDFALRR